MSHTVWGSNDDGTHVRSVHTFHGFDSQSKATKLATKLTKICQGQYWAENS